MSNQPRSAKRAAELGEQAAHHGWIVIADLAQGVHNVQALRGDEVLGLVIVLCVEAGDRRLAVDDLARHTGKAVT